MNNYPYSVDDDFGGVVPNFTQLRQEIEAAGITSATYQYHTREEDEVQLWFDGPLSAGDETILDGVVAAHVPANTTQSAQKAQSLAEEQTPETTWQQKLSLTLPPMKNGDYQFNWYCEIKTAGQAVQARVTYNGNEQGITTWGENFYHSFSGVVVATMQEGNAPTVAIEYRVFGSGPAYIQRARLSVVLLDREV